MPSLLTNSLIISRPALEDKLPLSKSILIHLLLSSDRVFTILKRAALLGLLRLRIP